jgi:hypothetical protein
MAQHEDKIHKQMLTGFSNYQTNPAVLGLLLSKAPLHMQEEMLKYFISYIKIMADKSYVRMDLLPTYKLCKELAIHLEELGLLDIYDNNPLDTNEYMAV